ncbi:MAG: nlpI 2 [Chthoniobacteraceae bacterium]|nr:nlpI 2 [Chthoniobacteraceae bacterium]
MRFPALFLAVLISISTLFAQEPGIAEKELAAATEALLKAPDSVPLLSHRGDCNLFTGHFAEAVVDFEKMIALDPSQDAPHWRLGIAYYFAGNFEKSAKQFEKYHLYDGHDRENGIWKFLADARREGIEKARTRMLAYDAFDREPFPSLYEMLAGRKSGAEVLAEIEKKGLAGNPNVEFFAHYYIGLNEELLGRRDEAKEHLKKAVAVYEGRRPSSSASYMWQVARLNAAALKKPVAVEAKK